MLEIRRPLDRPTSRQQPPSPGRQRWMRRRLLASCQPHGVRHDPTLRSQAAATCCVTELRLPRERPGARLASPRWASRLRTRRIPTRRQPQAASPARPHHGPAAAARVLEADTSRRPERPLNPYPPTCRGVRSRRHLTYRRRELVHAARLRAMVNTVPRQTGWGGPLLQHTPPLAQPSLQVMWLVSSW